MKIRPKEKSVHKQVAAYLKLQYPDLIFRTDFAACAQMSMGQIMVNKTVQSGPHFPDLQILKPAGGWHGLMLELKRDRSDVYYKDGRLKPKMVYVYKMFGGKKIKVSEYDHHAAQDAMLKRLSALGYKAIFACGFDHAREEIDEYLKQGLV